MVALPLNLVQCRISCATASFSTSSQRPKCELSGRTTSEPMHGSFPAPSFPTEGTLTMSSGATSPQLLSAKGKEENLEFCFATTCARLGLVGLAAAALCYTFPALAYRGGGPYGMEVTRGQDLTGKDFSGRALVKQDFKTSILRQANFKGAKLLGASFFDSDLTGADLTDADLRFADFSLANVAKANLTNANLEGALVTGNTSFKGAIITGADFTDVLWRDDQRNQLCLSADGVNSNTGHATRETLLCE